MTERLDDLEARFGYLRDYYSDMYTEMKLADEYYNGKFEMTAPEQAIKYHLPTARNNIEIATLQLITDSPVVRRRREAHLESWKADDDKVEKAIQNWLLDMELYQQTPVLADAAKLLIKRGQVHLAGPFFSDLDNEIWMEPYDPMTVYIEPGMRPTEAFVHLEMTVAEMVQWAKRVKKLSKFDRKDRKLTELITLIQWWQYEPGEKMGRYAAWIEKDQGFLAEPQVSGYPYLPLEPVWSGWGQDTIGVKPVNRAVSMLHPQYRDALRAESEMFTLNQRQAAVDVFGHYYLEQGQNIPEDFVVNWEAGSITPDVPVGGLHEFPRGKVSEVIREQWNILQGVLHESGVQPILAGQRQQGVTTATESSLLSGNARKRFYPPVRMLQGGVSRVARKLCKLAELLGKTYPKAFEWRGAALTEELLHEDYDVVVELLSEDVEERRLLRAQGLTLKDELSESTRMEDFYGIENVHEERVKKLVDKIINSDMVLNEIARRIGVVAQEGEKGPGGQTQAVNPLQQVAAVMRAGRQGFVPAQPGTIEGQAQLVESLQQGAMGGR